MVGYPSGAGCSGCRLDPDPVVYGSGDALGAAEVPLGRLHRDVPQEELNLLQVAASSAAEVSARPTPMPHAA